MRDDPPEAEPSEVIPYYLGTFISIVCVIREVHGPYCTPACISIISLIALVPAFSSDSGGSQTTTPKPTHRGMVTRSVCGHLLR